mmetsp:Transcript_9189/g.13858  ORF Transcript_9189/g.13858 Transcript_9189/m.13858 type:complete len:667 (-) Transcript_9189:1525-3525(-)
MATFYNPTQWHYQEVTLAVGTVTAALLFLLYKVYVTVSTNGKEKKFTKKSLPKSSMSILETIQMMAGRKVPIQLFDMAKDLGSWNFELNLPVPGHPKVVVVAEAEDARSIFRDSLTEKPKSIYGQLMEMSPTKSPSMFAMQTGAEWHRRRKGTAPAFSQTHIRRMNQVAVKHTEKWLKEILTPMVQNNESFDVVKELLKVVLRAFSETALQYDISDEEIYMFITEWDLIAKEYVLKSAANPFRKYLTAILPERRRAVQACDSVYKLFHRIINNYRNLDSPMEGTVIDLIMKNPTFKNDENIIASELFLYMVAGHDTTAISVSWILMELGKNPQEQRSLRKALSNMKPEEWSKSELLRNVAREGMRLHPVSSHTVARELGRDMITKKGYFLQKGTLAFLPFYVIFRNNEIFEDAEAFLPSRWENPTESMKRAFIPFATGVQNCVGQALANAELHSILARMIYEFDFSVEDEGYPEGSLVFTPVGLRMKATRAKLTMDDNSSITQCWQGWADEERKFGLEMQQPYSKFVLNGQKSIESRAYPLPEALIDAKIEILQSEKGLDGVSSVPDRVTLNKSRDDNSSTPSPLKRIGWVTFAKCIQYTTREEFEADREKHLVDPNSGYGWNDERPIYGWVVGSYHKQDVVDVDKGSVDAVAVRRMRSLFDIITT